MPKTAQRKSNNDDMEMRPSRSSLGTAAMLGAVAGAVAGAAAGVILSNDEYRERVKDILDDLAPDTQRLKKAVDQVITDKGRDMLDKGIDRVRERVGMEEDSGGGGSRAKK